MAALEEAAAIDPATVVALYGLIGVVAAALITGISAVVVALIKAHDESKANARDREALERERVRADRAEHEAEVLRRLIIGQPVDLVVDTDDDETTDD